MTPAPNRDGGPVTLSVRNYDPDRDGGVRIAGRWHRLSVAILDVMNLPRDRDAGVRTVRIVEVSPDRGAPSAAPLSPDAARARRYRARKRGEDVPKRKPGPEPRSVTAQSREVDALRRENARLAAEVAESRKLTPILGMRRQRFTLGMAGHLRAALEASDPAKDAPALREALRDLGAAIEARHDHWPE